MSDIKELFDMVTKHTEPHLDSWKEQEDRHRRAARNRRNGAYAVAAAVVLIAALAVTTLRSGGPPQQPMETPPDTAGPTTVVTHDYLDISTGERSPVAADLTDARLPEVSPDGSRIAYSTCCDDDAIYVAHLDGSGTETITPPRLDGYGPTWIDDRRILFQGRPEHTNQLGDLYVADLTTGEVTLTVDLPDERNGAWIIESDMSPDGTTVLFHLPRGREPNTE